jgi:ADP-ribosyl-[dinitrogen reductase] hydrolase
MNQSTHSILYAGKFLTLIKEDRWEYVDRLNAASLWCLLTTSNFPTCVLKAVNSGGDTDTTGCVAGGLAGVAYGGRSIPAD